MAVPFTDLARLHKTLKDEILAVLEDLLTRSDFVMGPPVKAFEDAFAKEMKAQHAVAVGSGSDALSLSLHALGLAPGEEVICPAFASLVLPEAIMRTGASVVFVDVGPDLTISPEAIKAAITEKTRAIVAVHLYGLASEMDQLTQIAADYDLYLVEDCTHACGAEWAGRSVGTMGISGCFSFAPTSNLGALGEAGLVLTESAEMAERIRIFRDHGRDEFGRSVALGFEGRMDTLQASVLNLKLPSLREDIEDRVANATYYDTHLTKENFLTPPQREDGSHAFNYYTVRFAQRDEMRSFLAERHIETDILYALPLHLQPCLEFLGYREGHFPQAEAAARSVLSLPIFPGLSRHELDQVVHTMELYVKTHPMAPVAPVG